MKLNPRGCQRWDGWRLRLGMGSAGAPPERGAILYGLRQGPVRFNVLRRLIPSVTERRLTNQLSELEADGLVVRAVYAEVPPKLECSLSPREEAPF
jgi:DNA-binding HxlR family transcriptional regulator